MLNYNSRKTSKLNIIQNLYDLDFLMDRLKEVQK